MLSARCRMRAAAMAQAQRRDARSGRAPARARLGDHRAATQAPDAASPRAIAPRHVQSVDPIRSLSLSARAPGADPQ